MSVTETSLVRRYYDALDAHDYDELASLLASSFVQQRPDRRFDDRDAFVRFMREERPTTDTSHDLVDVFAVDDRVVARGRLLDSRGDPVFEFADVFRFENDLIAHLDTYTR